MVERGRNADVRVIAKMMGQDWKPEGFGSPQREFMPGQFWVDIDPHGDDVNASPYQRWARREESLVATPEQCACAAWIEEGRDMPLADPNREAEALFLIRYIIRPGQRLGILTDHGAHTNKISGPLALCFFPTSRTGGTSSAAMLRTARRYSCVVRSIPNPKAIQPA